MRQYFGRPSPSILVLEYDGHAKPAKLDIYTRKFSPAARIRAERKAAVRDGTSGHVGKIQNR
jgi:hypothetical protein